MNNLFKRLLLICLICFYTPISYAELTIEITKGIDTAVPIAVVPFGWRTQGTELQPPLNLASVIQNDLSGSGLFKTLPENDMLTQPTEVENVRYRNWKALGQDYLLIGMVTKETERYKVQFQLFDIFKGVQLLGYRLTVSKRNLRRAAHHISDVVYQKLTGRKGVFNTRIAYITSGVKTDKQKIYKLLIADADGYNPRTITSSLEPLMSPAWSVDGKKIAYVSFENKHSAIYVQTLTTGKRERVAAFKGINGAPAFSPDGSKLAITLSRDGSPDIYVLDLNSKILRKITRSYAIDTEPSWSPDGSMIVYTSDRGGQPQLYLIPSVGGNPTRLTYDGNYNTRAQFSADGQSIVLVHGNQGDYRIAIMDMATRTINVLTAGRFDESPSFAANGDMILYAAHKYGKSVLSSISVDGRMERRLSFDKGDVREPAWSRK
ncbi:MAG: Tol-Pal system beta propeller repeat protein TolB [Methylococcales bacterium]|nr:Tol-Pal system beta propeller repeat protein TolB [Methylococcales bacterium]